jgi:predicted ester cyclase
MTTADLSSVYRSYIACLNAKDWPSLGRFVHDEVKHNGRLLGLSGYREMLEQDYAAIPDLFFRIELLVAEPPRVASRLQFDCAPKGSFLGLPVNGRTVSFAENVFYEFKDAKIVEVLSILDKGAIERQLQKGGSAAV